MLAMGRAGPVRRHQHRPTPAARAGLDPDTGRDTHCRAALLRTATVLALSSFVACAGLTRSPTGPDLTPWPEIRPDFRVEALRLRMHEYAITFAAAVDIASMAIEQNAADATVRRNAVLWRVRAIPEMRKACFRLEPIGALVDAWIFARQMEHLFRDGPGAVAFGTLQPEALQVSRRLLDQIREIGDSIAVSSETRVQFEQKFIDPWLAAHPFRDMTFVRESPIGRFAEQSPGSGDLFQSVGTMEELAVTLSQQARIYLADLPRQVRGEVDLMRSDILPEGLSSMQGDLKLSAAAADRIASVAEGISPLILDERRIVLEEANRQRTIVMEALSQERELALGAFLQGFAAERSELLRVVELQRQATLDWATTERQAAVADVRAELAASMAVLRDERVRIVGDLRQIVDTIQLRLVLLLLAAVVLAPLVAHAYARVWPRRWREP